jgi:hypothetical protein
VFETYTQRGIDAVAPEWEAPDGTGPVRGALEGTVRNTPRAALEHGRDVVGRELSGAATDLAHGEDVDALRGSHWRGERVGDELGDFAADRARDALSGTARGVARERNRRAADTWLDSTEGRDTLARYTRPDGMTDDQLRAFLRAEYIDHGADGAFSPGAQRRLDRVAARVARNLAERTPPMNELERREYLAWVYAGPASMEARAVEGDATGHLTNPIPDPEVTTETLDDDEADEVRAAAADPAS